MKSLGLLLIALVLVVLLVPPFFFLRLIRDAIRRESVADYLKTCALGLDQLGGSVLYNEEDFTVSSMTYEKSRLGNRAAEYFRQLIDFLAEMLGDMPNHCERSYYDEIQKIKRLAG